MVDSNTKNEKTVGVRPTRRATLSFISCTAVSTALYSGSTVAQSSNLRATFADADNGVIVYEYPEGYDAPTRKIGGRVEGNRVDEVQETYLRIRERNSSQLAEEIAVEVNSNNEFEEYWNVDQYEKTSEFVCEFVADGDVIGSVDIRFKSSSESSELKVTFDDVNDGVIRFNRDSSESPVRYITGRLDGDGATDEANKSFVIRDHESGEIRQKLPVSVNSDAEFRVKWDTGNYAVNEEYVGGFTVEGDVVESVDIVLSGGEKNEDGDKEFVVEYEGTTSAGTVELPHGSGVELRGRVKPLTSTEKIIEIRSGEGELVEEVSVDVDSSGEFTAVVDTDKYPSDVLVLRFYDGDVVADKSKAIVSSDVKVRFTEVTGGRREVNENSNGVLEVRPNGSSGNVAGMYNFTGQISTDDISELQLRITSDSINGGGGGGVSEIDNGEFSVPMKLNELSSGDRFTVVVVVDGNVVREVKGVVLPPRVDVGVYQHEGGRVLLPQGTDVEVSGEASNISPDSNVAVKFVGLDSRSDIRREMDVVGNGEFRTTIDTTAIPVETEFRMVIDIDGGEVYNSKAVISGEKERNSSASETKQREGESRKQEAQREKERREEEKRREEQREEQPQSDSSSGENSESDAERPDNTGSDESDRSSGSSESVDVEVVVDAIIEWLSN